MTARPHACPAVLVAAPASGQGKTTVAAALARLHARAGRRVRAFKCGADFNDPFWLELATGAPVHNIDLWITGEDDARARLHDAAADADLLIVEGAMGLFDGEPSAADVAVRFGLPVLAVIDASAMVGTFGALAFGLQHYRPGLPWAGVLANRVAGAGHARMLEQSLRTRPDCGWLGALCQDLRLEMPQRHLGLVPAGELRQAMECLDAAADALAATEAGSMQHGALDRWRVDFPPAVRDRGPGELLSGARIAVARDAAFCFIYPANLETLSGLGAELVFFSPLRNEPVPRCDAVWLPGGYPELHAAALSASTASRASLDAHVQAGRPVWAECGGMMVLFDSLVDGEGVTHSMWGLLPGQVRMRPTLAALGPSQLALAAGTLRGHSFHYSQCDAAIDPVAATRRAGGGEHGPGEPVFARRALRASYFHAWFPSDPGATASLFAPADPWLAHGIRSTA